MSCFEPGLSYHQPNRFNSCSKSRFFMCLLYTKMCTRSSFSGARVKTLADKLRIKADYLNFDGLGGFQSCNRPKLGGGGGNRTHHQSVKSSCFCIVIWHSSWQRTKSGQNFEYPQSLRALFIEHFQSFSLSRFCPWRSCGPFLF